MPFDGTGVRDVVVNRARLVAALRAPMPKGFTWDYAETHTKTNCGTLGCAKGLALEIGIPGIRPHHSWTVSDALGLSHALGYEIFLGVATYGFDPQIPRNWSLVTPQMVADKLEAAPFC